MAKFKIGVVLNLDEAITARLGDGAGTANPLAQADNGKFVKLAGDSQYGLCAVGNEIEGIVQQAGDIAKADGFVLGSVVNSRKARVEVTLDGLQGTPGTGVVAIGDYVVAGTVVARGTALSGAPKACKATAAGTALNYKWRVLAFTGPLGTGAVGQTAIIERV